MSQMNISALINLKIRIYVKTLRFYDGYLANKETYYMMGKQNENKKKLLLEKLNFRYYSFFSKD